MRFCLLLILTILPPLAAFDLAPIPIPELARRAELIVRGQVVEKSIQRDPAGRIYTQIKLNISESLKGDPKTNPFTITAPGGTVGELRDFSPHDASYAINEEIIAFLIRNPSGQAITLAGAQGKFQIDKEKNEASNAARKLPVSNLTGLLAAK